LRRNSLEYMGYAEKVRPQLLSLHQQSYPTSPEQRGAPAYCFIRSGGLK
jgi:hypothetical protein